MKKNLEKTKILVAPLHYVIDPDEGSEYTRAYEYLEYLSKDEKLSGDVLVGYCKINKLGNFRIHKMFNKKPAYISNVIRFKFIVWVFFKSLFLMRKNIYNLIWHQGPFAIDETFNLLALLNRKKIPFVIGPIFSPLNFTGTADFGLLGKKTKIKSSLALKNKIDGIVYKHFSKSFSYLSFLTLKKASQILSHDNIGKNLINKKGIKNIQVLTLSVISKDFTKRKQIRTKKYFILLAVGYFIERKRMIDIIEAVRILVSIHKIKNIRLTLIGDGTQKAEMKILTKKYKLEKFINFTGFIPRTKLAEHYKNSDIFLSASTADIMPGVYFEAMSASLPMVLAKNSTSKELSARKFGGFVVPAKSPKSIAISVQKLIKNKKLLAEYGQRNFLLMQNEYNFEKNIGRLKNIFQNLN